MTIGAVSGVLSRATTPLSGAGQPQVATPKESATSEANESPAVTKREAAQGDAAAILKLKKQAATKPSSEPTEKKEAPAPETSSSGDAAALQQGKGGQLSVAA